MKSRGVTRRRGTLAGGRRLVDAIGLFSAVLVLALVVGTAGSSRAQDEGKDGTSWEHLDSVLEVPPVYQPDTGGAPDACAEDCPASNSSATSESPTAVVGSAEDPTNPSAGISDNPPDGDAAIDGSALDVAGAQAASSGPSGSRQTQEADGGSQDTNGLDSSLGSEQEYEEQQAMAEELGNSCIVQMPPVIIGAPVEQYYVPGAFAPRTFAPAGAQVPAARSLPASPAWMPQPMARVVPLPSIVPHGVPRTVTGFPGGGSGGFHGGFAPAPGLHGGFGFHGGFGHR